VAYEYLLLFFRRQQSRTGYSAIQNQKFGDGIGATFHLPSTRPWHAKVVCEQDKSFLRSLQPMIKFSF
jgi:hypothetical protein